MTDRGHQPKADNHAQTHPDDARRRPGSDFTPAQADQVTGTIMAVDVILHQFMLSDGGVYGLPKSITASKLTLGSKVKVTYTSSHGANMATAVIRVK